MGEGKWRAYVDLLLLLLSVIVLVVIVLVEALAGVEGNPIEKRETVEDMWLEMEMSKPAGRKAKERAVTTATTTTTTTSSTAAANESDTHR